ncbi:helix-turn-helix domain-containing protein [Iamia sp. SCSIO 61187]|uniref:AAA family ATPase n=1 Tax=Iamia sp. SCSIO 61187 TaxID=2722752 RepID=UPI001C624AB6|nr:LuxR family transcriptional regulator [Iamia sp. SCSIO 61187]QYG94150.1 helix-turn-helix domain-containing protein [Iamia sp. SCSIO 61187]
MLVGRKYDLASVTALLDDVRSGQGRALALVGRPGVGKSVLLDAAAARADGITVVRATAVEAETDLAWAGLASLLEPLVDEGALAGLAAPRRAALERILLIEDDGGPVDLRAVAVATLDVLTAAAGAARPLLLVVDDLHWLDDETRRVLGYVARRIADDPIGLLAASRVAGDLPQRTIVDLDRASAEELLRHEGVGPALRTRVLADLGTNPMLLVEAVRQLDPAVRAGTVPPPEVLPLPATLAAGARQRVAALDAESRTALLVVATAARPDLGVVEAVLAEVGATSDALTRAEEAQIVARDRTAGTVAFAHPTLRAAVLEAAPDPDRRRAHAALARHAPDAVARAVHRALAADAPDEEVAIGLEGAAEELWRAGALTAAATELERAAALSGLPLPAAARRVRAAEARLDLGSTAHADRLLDEAEALIGRDDGPSEARAAVAARLARMRGRALIVAGRDAEAAEALTALAHEIEDDMPDEAARALLEALGALVRTIDTEGTLAAVADLAAVAERSAPDVQLRAAAIAAALDSLITGDAAPAVALARQVLAAEGVAAAGTLIGSVMAPMLSYRARGGEVLALLREVEAALREAAALVPLALVLSALQLHHHGRDQVAAVLAADEAIELAAELGTPRLATVAAHGLCVAAAAAGDRAALGRAQEVLRGSDLPSDVTVALVGEASLLMAEGAADEAVAVYERLADRVGVGRNLSRWEPEHVEALVRARRPADARRLLDALAAAGLEPLAPTRFARVRALVVGDDDEATVLFASSCQASEDQGDRLGWARTQLCWGEWARRRRRKAEARTHLEAAAEVLAQVGAGPWARRAVAELVAAGGAAPGEAGPGHEDLTPQELRIARLAAGGASNREIGGAVFLSERTVEAHLSAVYRKLQVRGRRGLAARAVDDPWLRPAAG